MDPVLLLLAQGPEQQLRAIWSHLCSHGGQRQLMVVRAFLHPAKCRTIKNRLSASACQVCFLLICLAFLVKLLLQEAKWNKALCLIHRNVLASPGGQQEVVPESRAAGARGHLHLTSGYFGLLMAAHGLG